MTRLKIFFNSKTFYIIAAAFLGIMTWFLVFNTTNPTESRTIEIPLEILNAHSPMAVGLSERYASVPDNITVKVSGRSEIIGNLSISDLSAAVDFSGVKKSGIMQLKIKEPECSRLGIKIVDYYPKSVDVEFDNVSQKNVDVLVDYDDTLLEDGFEFLSVTSEPENIQISGFASDIEQIDFIKVFLKDSLNEKSIDSDKIGSFLGHYIKKSGEDASSDYENEKIMVKIEVAKRIPLKYTLVGEPNKDYYVVSESISDKTVLVRGSSVALRNIKEIDLGEISIEDIQKNTFIELALKDYLPADVTPYQLEKVSVNIKVNPYERRTFKLDMNDISLNGKKDEYEYDFTPDKFDIIVKGKPADLEELTVATLGAKIDLRDCDEGNHTKVLSFEGIDQEKFYIIGEYVCNVIIEKLVVEDEIPEVDGVLPTDSNDNIIDNINNAQIDNMDSNGDMG